MNGHPDVRGVVLAGIHRWGASPFDALRPRPLLPIAESPLIGYPLRWLRDAGIHDVTVCANSESRAVQQVLDDGRHWGLDLRYFEDLTPRGPAGCIRDAGAAWPARELVVVEGHVLPTVDLPALLATHRASAAALTVVASRAGGTGPGDRWTSPAGIYVFSQRALAAVPLTGYQDIKETLIPRLHAERAAVVVFESTPACQRVSDLDSYLAANGWLLARLAAGALTLPGYRRRGQALVHSSAAVAEPARLAGPVVVGPQAEVAARATLIGPTVIGAGSHVGSDAIISRSVIWDACELAAGVLLDQCLVPSGVRVTAASYHPGTIISGPPAERARPHPDRPRRCAALRRGGQPVPVVP